MLRSFAVALACLFAVTAIAGPAAGATTPTAPAASSSSDHLCHFGGSWGDPGPGDDVSGCVVVTPAAPAFVDGTCAATWNGIVIDHTAGVNYYLSVNGGSERYVGNSRHRLAYGTPATITARAMSGRVTAGTTVWRHSFPAAPACGGADLATVTADDVDFADPACDGTGAAVTIPDVDGVDYVRDGVVLTPGEHTVATGSSWTITVSAQPGYQLTATPTWTHVFAVDTGCVQPAAVTFAGASCTWATGSYTIPAVAGVDYLVDDRAVTAGRHARPASHALSISASARAGYTLFGAVEWDAPNVAAAQGCSTTTAPAGPTTPTAGTTTPPAHTNPARPSTPAHGVDAAGTTAVPASGAAQLANTGVPVAALTTAGLLLAAAGGALILLGRRPASAPRRPRH